MIALAIRPRVLFGTDVDEGRFRNPYGTPWYYFEDALNGSYMTIDDACASRHILLLGGTGSGKTNIMNWIFRQARRIPVANNTTYIVFDTKADYIRHKGFRLSGDIVVGNGREFRDESAIWNLFEEVLVDGPDARDFEPNAREMSKTLFEGRGSQMQPFFANAATDIFAGAIAYFIRRSQERPESWRGQLNNAELLRFITSDAKILAKAFETYGDMHGLITYFGDGSSGQGMGVLGELRSMVSDCFQGIFASKPYPGTRGFSIRKAVRDKGGRSVFVEYDLALGLSLQPIYRLMFDLALKESLGSSSGGHTLLFLDELRLLPKLSHLEDALNFGRSKGISVVAGLQSIEQLDAAYGSEEGRTVIGAFGSLITLRTPDATTMRYVSDRFGTNVTSYRYESVNGQPEDREREGHVVEPWRIRRLGLGEAVVGLSTQTDPFIFHFKKENV